MRRQVGQFSSHIINLLELDIEVGTPIYISDTNIEHMKSSHPMILLNMGMISNILFLILIMWVKILKMILLNLQKNT